MYQRILENIVKKNIGSGKAIIIVGARQIWKTTLIINLLEKEEYLFIDAENLHTFLPNNIQNSSLNYYL